METDEQKRQEEQAQIIPPIGQPMMTIPMAARPVVPAAPAMAGASGPAIQPAAPSAPIAMPQPKEAAVQRVVDAAGRIQNPFARILARTGAGILQGAEGVAEGVAPRIAEAIPGSIMRTGLENAQARKTYESEQAMRVAQEKADTERQAEQQKPIIEQQREREAAARDASKEVAAEKREQEREAASEKSLQEREDAAEKARTQSEKASADRQAAQFRESEKLEGMRESARDKQLQERSTQEKITADEQRRADLAENLNENLDSLEDIVKRRPELFGPLAGRWAELKQKFGSNDPDLAKLQTIEHQIGMAQISAHGMRSAQGVQAAADSILNNLHNGTGAMLGAIGAVRNSVKTFTRDVESKKPGAKAGKAEATNSNDPMGIL